MYIFSQLVTTDGYLGTEHFLQYSIQTNIDFKNL